MGKNGFPEKWGGIRVSQRFPVYVGAPSCDAAAATGDLAPDNFFLLFNRVDASKRPDAELLPEMLDNGHLDEVGRPRPRVRLRMMRPKSYWYVHTPARKSTTHLRTARAGRKLKKG